MTSSESTQPPAQQVLSPEEIKLRQQQVRRLVLLRGLLLGLIMGAWWALFAPDSLVEAPLRYVLAVVIGVVAAGSYLFYLRETLFPKADK
jgi:hypothetical protein